MGGEEKVGSLGDFGGGGSSEMDVPANVFLYFEDVVVLEEVEVVAVLLFFFLLEEVGFGLKIEGGEGVSVFHGYIRIFFIKTNNMYIDW